jgi:hypothetical protein
VAIDARIVERVPRRRSFSSRAEQKRVYSRSPAGSMASARSRKLSSRIS